MRQETRPENTIDVQRSLAWNEVARTRQIRLQASEQAHKARELCRAARERLERSRWLLQLSSPERPLQPEHVARLALSLERLVDILEGDDAYWQDLALNPDHLELAARALGVACALIDAADAGTQPEWAIVRHALDLRAELARLVEEHSRAAAPQA